MRVNDSGNSSSALADRAEVQPQHDEHLPGAPAPSGTGPCSVADHAAAGQATLNRMARDGTEARVLASAGEPRQGHGFWQGLVHQASDLWTARDHAIESAGQWVADKGAEVKNGFDQMQETIRADADRRGGVLGAIEKLGSVQTDVTAGFVFGAADFVGSTAKLAYGASQLANPIEWAVNSQANLARAQATGQALEALGSVTSPTMWALQPDKNSAIAKNMWAGLTQGYREGNAAQGVGRAVFDIGSLFVGVGEAKAGLQTAEVASAASKGLEAARAAEGAAVLAESAPALKAGETAAADVARVSGARDVLNPRAIEAWDRAEAAYDAVRANPADVADIAKNTGWSEADIAQIKDHLFVKEHQLDERVARFDADPDIYNAWDRLSRGDFVSSDIDLLQHELFESNFEAAHGVNYRTAHEATLRAGYTWIPE